MLQWDEPFLFGRLSRLLHTASEMGKQKSQKTVGVYSVNVKLLPENKVTQLITNKPTNRQTHKHRLLGFSCETRACFAQTLPVTGPTNVLGPAWLQKCYVCPSLPGGEMRPLRSRGAVLGRDAGLLDRV